MNVDCFLDTNVLVAPGMAETNFGLSAQVLQEFFVRIVRCPLIRQVLSQRQIATREGVDGRSDWWWKHFPLSDSLLGCGARDDWMRHCSIPKTSMQIYGRVRVENPFRIN